jgi:AcrR family transcriptional regulator
MPQNVVSTSAYILEKIAPVFNRQGYVGTSLSDLTKATGLTKGAIYCNFTNKEELAIKAFDLNVGVAISPLFKLIKDQEISVQKLYAITNYHRTYYDLVKDIGGCPMLRVGVDTKYINPLLFDRAQKLSQKFINGLVELINEGISKNQIKKNTNAVDNAKLILSIIEGSSLLSFTHNDNTFMINAMDFIDKAIIEKIRM